MYPCFVTAELVNGRYMYRFKFLTKEELLQLTLPERAAYRKQKTLWCRGTADEDEFDLLCELHGQAVRCAEARGTRVSLRDWTIGPPHDPYGASELTVQRHGHAHVLYSDGLGAISYKVDDLEICEGVDTAMSQRVVDLFAARTGATPWQWESWYHEHIYAEDPMSKYC